MQRQEFKCSRCGACCSQLFLFNGLFHDLDRGDGVCIHYKEQEHACGIYENRPLKCRIKEGYEYFFHDIPWDEYLKANTDKCIFLRNNLYNKKI